MVDADLSVVFRVHNLNVVMAVYQLTMMQALIAAGYLYEVT